MSECIEYCLSNTDSVDHPKAEGRLCLQQCGLCYGSPFLVVDGEIRIGESHRELLASITEGEP